MGTSDAANVVPCRAMKVLLLGGSGLLGGAARDAFVAAGHDVTVVSRGVLANPGSIRTICVDRKDRVGLAAALAGERFDFTVDFLAYDGDDVTALFDSGLAPGKLVMISTGQVYLVAKDPRPPFRESDAASPPMPEPEQGTRAHGNWTYGMGKRAAEAALVRESAARGVSSLALRIPAVQGEGDGRSTARLWAWIERMRDGGPLILPDTPSRLRFVHSNDVAAALVKLAEGATWPNVPALNVAQPEECSLREFLDLVARAVGVTPTFVSVDPRRLAEAGLADALPYTGPWWSNPDPTAARALGFVTHGPEAYLPSVVRAHLERPPASHESYALRSKELALLRP